MMIICLIVLNIGNTVKLGNVLLPKCAEDQLPLNPPMGAMPASTFNVDIYNI